MAEITMIQGEKERQWIKELEMQPLQKGIQK
jgi:hypothetical protein